jgi:cell division protein FtsA
MSEQSNAIMGLDIGSNKVSVAICQIDIGGNVHILGLGTSVAAGMNKGKIEDIDDLYRSIERAILRASRDAGLKPTRVVASILPYRLQCVKNIGVLLSKEDTGQISDLDKRECIRRSKNVVTAQDQTMVHVIPNVFRVDGVDVQNPVGVFGKKLEVETLVVMADSDCIINQTRILKGLQLHISGLMTDVLASAEIYLTKDERQHGAVLCDIGGQFTKIAMFKHGLLTQSAIIPIGGDTFSKDVSACIKITLPESERLKILYGDVSLSRVDPYETIDAATKETGKKPIKRLLLSQILEARALELLKLIQQQIPDAFDPSLKFVLCGGGSQLRGLAGLIELKYSMNIREGLPEDVHGVVSSPLSATAVGLVMYGLKTGAVGYHFTRWQGLKQKVKRWFKIRF